MENSRKIWYDQNDQPPKNYIWYKNGQYLEWNGNKWAVSEGLNSKDEITEDMTPEQQMQVRKNLGLYYEESTEEEKTAKFTDEQQSSIVGFAIVSTDTPAKDDLIKVIWGGEEYAMSDSRIVIVDTTDGYNVFYMPTPTTPVEQQAGFKIVLNDSQEHDLGIYVNMMTAIMNSQQLVYKGTTTTIEKIDEKFLPEQEDVGPIVVSDITSLSLPPNVLAKAKAGDVFVEKNATTGTETVYILSFMPHTEGSFGEDVYNIYFINIDGANTTVVRYNTTGFPGMWSYSGKSVFELGTIPGPIEITGLPTASMTTTADLQAIGLTYQLVGDAAHGQKTGIYYHEGENSNERCHFIPILNAEHITTGGAYSWILEFNYSGNHYKIQYDYMMSFSVTVTVTPIS